MHTFLVILVTTVVSLPSSDTFHTLIDKLSIDLAVLEAAEPGDTQVNVAAAPHIQSPNLCLNYLNCEDCIAGGCATCQASDEPAERWFTCHFGQSDLVCCDRPEQDQANSSGSNVI
eukprot:c2836_g1_i1.p1 GENE.c2836_g1_i1~~c2836_g1_i1.p1  ORF type:complete len:116 (+),score=16.22 c2836_g1_i1:135-482(+)